MKHRGICLVIIILFFSNVSQQTSQTTATIIPKSNITNIEITSDTFVTKWDTSKSGVSASNQISLPLESTGKYNFIVDWGDNSTNTITTWNQAETNHTYASVGVYDILINGNLSGWSFGNSGDKLKIIELSQWGNMSLGNSGSYFSGASNMVLTATDAPDLSGTTNLERAFKDCSLLGSTGNMNLWNVSSVTKIWGIFQGATSFNQPIGNWNTLRITDMSFMFKGATSFNQSIENLNMSSVHSMYWMFQDATSFNQPIGNWDVSSVQDMTAMFQDATSFNQPIGNWDVSSVQDMTAMFQDATSFNQPIDNWDVSSVLNMNDMFKDTSLSQNNYDDLLANWGQLSLRPKVYFHAGNSTPTNFYAKRYIIENFNWHITDGYSVDTTNPIINSPADMTIEEGDRNTVLQWEVGDKSPSSYSISINDVEVIFLPWQNGTISYSLSDLEIGRFTITITLYDLAVNRASDTVIVSVTSRDSTSSDSDVISSDTKLTVSDRSLEASDILPVSITHGYVYTAMIFIISRIILLNYRSKSRLD
ncbi:MAG: BspA family leucine-rich repeat surface protein [Candidatus Heimdallarchaeota archaeon]|nr:BspA family leucine-rich repeat surface protein [Candidatus Heimdallarchaeota archaeon]